MRIPGDRPNLPSCLEIDRCPGVLMATVTIPDHAVVEAFVVPRQASIVLLLRSHVVSVIDEAAVTFMMIPAPENNSLRRRARRFLTGAVE